MRGSKSKRIRSMVYGDMSLRVERQYVTAKSGAVGNHPRSPRAVYLAHKKAYTEGALRV